MMEISKKKNKDFDFLSEISQTCKIVAESDNMILNRNKLKIFANVVKGYDFMQEEIDKFESDFEKSSDKINNDSLKIFLKRQTDERAKLYGNILGAISNLPQINQLFCRNIRIDKTRSTFRHVRYNASFLGIFHVDGLSNNAITKFIDRFDICKFFPGYLRNKETWNRLRGCNLNGRQFDNIVTGKNDAINGIDYCLNSISNIEYGQNQTDDYKDIGPEINDNKQIMNISIITKQRTIEDSWGQSMHRIGGE